MMSTTQSRAMASLSRVHFATRLCNERETRVAAKGSEGKTTDRKYELVRLARMVYEADTAARNWSTEYVYGDVANGDRSNTEEYRGILFGQ